MCLCVYESCDKFIERSHSASFVSRSMGFPIDISIRLVDFREPKVAI